MAELRLVGVRGMEPGIYVGRDGTRTPVANLGTGHLVNALRVLRHCAAKALTEAGQEATRDAIESLAARTFPPFVNMVEELGRRGQRGRIRRGQEP